MSVTPEDVRHVARLASLGISEERIPSLVKELNGILTHMDALQEVDTEGVLPTAGVGGSGTPLREDAGEPIAMHRSLESFAPSMRDGFFIVPRLATHEDASEETP